MRDLSENGKCNFQAPASGRILNRYEESNEFPSVNCLTGEGRKRGKQTAAAK